MSMSLSYVKHSHLGKATLTFGAISRINSARKFRHYHIASLPRCIATFSIPFSQVVT